MENLTKAELIRIVEESNMSQHIKKLVIAYAQQAYSIGLTDGMKLGAETMSKSFEMLLEKSDSINTRIIYSMPYPFRTSKLKTMKG